MKLKQKITLDKKKASFGRCLTVSRGTNKQADKCYLKL